MDDAYSKLYHMMRTAPDDGRQGSPIHIMQGKVLDNCPLKVDVAGTTQEAGRFCIPKRLVSWNGEKGCWQAAFPVGASILLLTEDDQTFYIFEEVMHL